MFFMHRLFLFLFISTTAITNVGSSTSSTPMISTSVTTIINSLTNNTNSANPHTSTTSTTIVNSTHAQASGSATTQHNSNATAPLPTQAASVTSPSTQINFSTTAPGNASSVSTGTAATSTPGNTTHHPATPSGTSTSSSVTATGHATTPPPSLTTAANSTIEHLSTPGNETTHTPPLPDPTGSTLGNTTTASSASSSARDNATSFSSTSGNTTVVANTATLTPAVNITTTSENPSTPPTTTLSNSTSGNATVPLVTTTGNETSALPLPGNTTTPSQPTPGNATILPTTSSGNGTTSATAVPQSTEGNVTSPSLTTTSNSSVPTTVTPATCPAVPCPTLSVCVNSACECLAGTLLENGICVETKTFPSKLRVNRTFTSSMNDPQSKDFKDIAIEIIAAVNKAMEKQPNYINSKVVKLTPGSVVAEVNSFFETNSPVTQKVFDSAFSEAIKECTLTSCGILKNANYTATSLCEQEPVPCDVTSTVCGMNEGLVSCACRSDYVPSPYQSKSCEVCPSGQKAEAGSCAPCPFGYSGFNCNDSSLLALVVVACVLGGILLILILAFLIYFCVTHRRGKSQDSLYNNTYPAADVLSTWPSQGITPIPRATLTSSSNYNAGDTSLEMTEGAGRKRNSNGLTGSYDLTTDGMRTFTGKNPSRYSYLVGHENPYYLDGEDRSTT